MERWKIVVLKLIVKHSTIVSFPEKSSKMASILCQNSFKKPRFSVEKVKISNISDHMILFKLHTCTKVTSLNRTESVFKSSKKVLLAIYYVIFDNPRVDTPHLHRIMRVAQLMPCQTFNIINQWKYVMLNVKQHFLWGGGLDGRMHLTTFLRKS